MVTPSTQTDVAALKLSGVTVKFGDFVANDNIGLDFKKSEVHAILGENGAGKTTLMRVVAGLLTPQHGEIEVDGRVVNLQSPLDAAAHGIGMVHQHFMLIPTLTVAQNVCLGLKQDGLVFPDLKKVASRLQDIANTYKLKIDPNAYVKDLSVASQQRVEIVKALYRGAKILVLDEPTAVLAPKEVEGLFDVLRTLARDGTSIIFISHKLHEVMEISNRVSVLRRGQLIATKFKTETDPKQLAQLMIGDELKLPTPSGAVAADAGDILTVDGLVCEDQRGVITVDGVTFSARAGEVVGIAGIDGNGQQELAEALVGLVDAKDGVISFDGTDVTAQSITQRIALGLSHIPEDRLKTALVDLPIADNFITETVGEEPFSKHGVLSRSAISAFGEKLVEEYDVRCTGISQFVTTLSGGNQQKIVIGRALTRNPKLVVAVQPTRGLDIGATAFVHKQLLAQRAAGGAVVLVSTELDEVVSLSDRILVMFAGKIVGELNREQVDVDRLSQLMTGQAA